MHSFQCTQWHVRCLLCHQRGINQLKMQLEKFICTCINALIIACMVRAIKSSKMWANVCYLHVFRCSIDILCCWIIINISIHTIGIAVVAVPFNVEQLIYLLFIDVINFSRSSYDRGKMLNNEFLVHHFARFQSIDKWILWLVFEE